jgi:HEAT repeat protein
MVSTAQLIQKMKHPDWEVRSRAISSIGRMNDEKEILGLIRKVREEKWDIREAVAQGLSEIRSPHGIAALLHALEVCPWFVRETAYSLKKCGIGLSPASFNRALEDGDPNVRACAIEALGLTGNEASARLLESAADPVPAVRRAVAVAFGRTGGVQAMDALTVLLQDPDAAVRRAAVWSLGRIGDTAARSTLLNALGDENRYVRRNAARALEEIGFLEIS